MHSRIHDARILAVDLRFRRSGFALFEGPKRLLDFGTVVIPSGRYEKAGSRFSDLMKLSLPSAIVVKKERWEDLMARSDQKPPIGALTNESEAHLLRIRLLEHGALISTFRNLGCDTKAQISTMLARIFPELVWQLPPERKVWQSEHPRQRVFDAIALGFAYWQRETAAIADPQVRMEIPEEGT